MAVSFLVGNILKEVMEKVIGKPIENRLDKIKEAYSKLINGMVDLQKKRINVEFDKLKGGIKATADINARLEELEIEMRAKADEVIDSINNEIDKEKKRLLLI